METDTGNHPTDSHASQPSWSLVATGFTPMSVQTTAASTRPEDLDKLIQDRITAAMTTNNQAMDKRFAQLDTKVDHKFTTLSTAMETLGARQTQDTQTMNSNFAQLFSRLDQLFQNGNPGDSNAPPPETAATAPHPDPGFTTVHRNSPSRPSTSVTPAPTVTTDNPCAILAEDTGKPKSVHAPERQSHGCPKDNNHTESAAKKQTPGSSGAAHRGGQWWPPSAPHTRANTLTPQTMHNAQTPLTLAQLIVKMVPTWPNLIVHRPP